MSKVMEPGYSDAKGRVIEGFDGNIIHGEGPTVPADGTTGYAPGCIWSKRAGGALGGFYVNEGTATSCDFNLLSLGTVDLSGLAATAAEINRVAKPSTRVVAAGAASLTVTQALHDGKTILLDQATGVAVTLPAMTGSGSRYRFVNSVATSGGSHVITATGAHLFGSVFTVTDTAATSEFTAQAAASPGGSTVITMNGTTQGGRKGDWVEIEDVAASVGIVRGFLNQSGTEATPFS